MRMLSGSVRMARCKLGVSGVLCELASVAFATGSMPRPRGYESTEGGGESLELTGLQ